MLRYLDRYPNAEMECFDQKFRDQLSMRLLDEEFTKAVVEAFNGACRGLIA